MQSFKRELGIMRGHFEYAITKDKATVRYYRLMDDLYTPDDRWFLKSLNVVDENIISLWKFLSPAKVDLPPSKTLQISVRGKGRPLDFTFADFELLVVNERVACFLDDEDCQLIPVDIQSMKNGHSYSIAVILKSLDCVDESRSNFDKWEADDPVRPDLAGNYKTLYKLYVDATKISDCAIFRLQKSDNIIIVNETLKMQFEKNKITGVKFRDVT